MSKRDALLARIRSEVAEHGKITPWALDAYVSGPISYAAMMTAAREGMRLHAKRAPAPSLCLCGAPTLGDHPCGGCAV